MKLKEKEFTKADGTVIKLTPEWISSKLGEVYELSHLDRIDQERLHYGYMTEALVSLLEATDKKGNPYFDRVGFANPKKNQAKYNTLRHKIILDKSSGIYDKNFIPNFFLYPTVYSEKEIKINNSNFTGKFEWVNKKYSDAQKLEIIISNSIFNRANVLYNNLDENVKIEINASEISGLLACDNLERISNSFIQDSTLAYYVRVVEDCFLKDYEAPANVKAILGFNSKKSEYKDEIQPINAKMLEEPDLL